ncbi:hypothetical protein [Streptomyces malaysiensis]|uniref:Lipoprotein n=1 Tax=Streptomyces malaysiensis TaxID=92644 RepID=A0A7X5X7I6_STRMQ|nr:hypothetical protein [Streptomyces malaysiensis]NIY67997.1 hypothetical protein [Streptomyces malaysiensis]
MRRYVLGVLALLVAVVGCSANESSTVDEKSYRAGYNAFGGAYLPPSDGTRKEIESQCDAMLREQDLADPKYKLVREDWITGCADAVEGKDSRVESD